MRTPEEEDTLRELAIAQIMEQIRQERAAANERELSKEALRRLAAQRHDKDKHLT